MFRFGDPGGRLYNALGTSQVNLLAWWTGPSGSTSNFTLTASGGRVTGSSLHSTLVGILSRVFDAQATWGVAFAIKITALPGSSGNTPMFCLVDSGTTQIELRIFFDGTVRVTRNGIANTLGTTSITIPTNVWTHVEWLSTINNTTGTTQVWINGVSALNLTGQNTRNTANNSANAVYHGGFITGGGTAGSYDFDDIIIYDGQSNDPQGNPDIHGQIGDCHLDWLLPTGAGTTTQFTPDTGSNYARVNEATPDGDTSYVQDSTVGHIDTYAMANLAAGVASVKSIAVVQYAEKVDSGSRSMKAEIRTNSANFSHTNAYSLGNSYQYFMNVWGQNPSGTPANWTPSDINAIEVGQTVSS